MFPRNSELPFYVSPDGYENGRVTFAQFFKGDAAADRGIQQDLDSYGAQPVQFRIQHRPGQPKRRNADREHPARHRQGFENGRAVTFLAEVVSAEKSGWARPHDGNFLRTLGHAGLRQLVIGAIVGDEALQTGQVHRIIHAGAGAGCGAGVRADPAADRWKWVIPQNDLEGLFEASLRDQSHIALPALVDRAPGLAGRWPTARDSKDVGHSLGNGR